MVVARLVNWPDTLYELTPAVSDGVLVTWRPKVFVREMHTRREAGEKVFSAAYIVSTNGHTMDKAEYLAERVLNPLWKGRKALTPRDGDTLASFHARLMEFDGMGSFMAAQVVCDVKYSTASPLVHATDWHTWAASGPGSRRGLNWVMSRDTDAPWKEAEWLATLTELKAKIDPLAENSRIPTIDAQNLQNCLCELFKYARGSSRSKYNGGGGAC